MIRFGDRLPVVILCPDCEKPLVMQHAAAYQGINPESDSDFVSVHCSTENCINRYFMTTVEKKTGLVLFTDARYRPSYENAKWIPLYPVYKTAEEMKKE